MKITKIQLFILFLVLFATTSCYSYRVTGLLQEHDKNISTYQPQTYENYRIRVNDEIYYRLITSKQEFSDLISGGISTTSLQNVVSYRVYSDGTIDLPFVNRIPVEGLTISEAEKAIEARMKEFTYDATVKLTLANKSFTIIGDIGTGIFPAYKEKLTIFQALAMSGDLFQSGDRKHIRILRETNEGPTILEFDIRPANIIESEHYYVYPNDIIYVQKAPASFYKVSNYSSFLGLINSSITLLFAVLTYTGNTN